MRSVTQHRVAHILSCGWDVAARRLLGYLLVFSVAGALNATATISPIELRGFFEDDKRLAQKTVFIDQFQGRMAARDTVQERIAFF
jgi:hypothetical protein